MNIHINLPFVMPHERLYQYSSLGLDFSTCLQSHTILLQFLIKNIAKLGFNWSLTYLQSICLSTKTEMVINITYINIYSWLPIWFPKQGFFIVVPAIVVLHRMSIAVSILHIVFSTIDVYGFHIFQCCHNVYYTCC